MPNIRTETTQAIKTGILIGLAGGAAELVVVGSYTAFTGADAGAVAHGVAASFGLQAGTQLGATLGVAIHMLLAAGLGAALYAVLRASPGWVRAYGTVPFLLGSLAAVWAINFLVVLPAVNPSFVHLLPYAVTLASKLAFGATAAAVLGYQQRGGLPAYEAGAHAI